MSTELNLSSSSSSSYSTTRTEKKEKKLGKAKNKNKKRKNTDLISLIPPAPPPKTLFVSDAPPGSGGNAKSTPVNTVLKTTLSYLQREQWVEGVKIRRSDQSKVVRYKKRGQLKSDFTAQQWQGWTTLIHDNTVICKINEKCGVGVYVLPGKKLPKGTFIIASGVLKSKEESSAPEGTLIDSYSLHLATSQKLNRIYPTKYGNIFALINHAFTESELDNVEFLGPADKEKAAVANLSLSSKYFQGIEIAGLEVIHDIEGGQQLLFSYPQIFLDYYDTFYTREALPIPKKQFFIFDKATGGVLDPGTYQFKTILLQIIFTPKKNDMRNIFLYTIRGKLLEEKTNKTLYGGDESAKFILEDKCSIELSCSFVAEQLAKCPEARVLVFSTVSEPPISGSLCYPVNWLLQYHPSRAAEVITVLTFRIGTKCKWKSGPVPPNQYLACTQQKDKHYLQYVVKYLKAHAEKVGIIQISEVNEVKDRSEYTINVLLTEPSLLWKLPQMPMFKPGKKVSSSAFFPPSTLSESGKSIKGEEKGLPPVAALGVLKDPKESGTVLPTNDSIKTTETVSLLPIPKKEESRNTYFPCALW